MIETNGELIFHDHRNKVTCSLEGGPIFFIGYNYLHTFKLAGFSKKGKINSIGGIPAIQIQGESMLDGITAVSKEWRWWWIMPFRCFLNRLYWRFKSWSILQLHQIGLAEREFACWPQWKEIYLIGFLYNKFRSLYERVQKHS